MNRLGAFSDPSHFWDAHIPASLYIGKNSSKTCFAYGVSLTAYSYSPTWHGHCKQGR